jgi:fatty-acyl-CoA synthase
MRLLELLERRSPAALAFVDGERRWSYAQLAAEARRAASWLAAHGVRAGDRVALWLVNRSEWLALLFGAAHLGAAIVAVNTRYRAGELEYLLGRSRPRLLVMQPVFRNLDFAAVLEGVSPAVRPEVVCIGTFTERFQEENRSDPDAPAAFFTTSGTTRGPKLVVHSQRTLALHADRVARALGLDQPGARLLAAMPYCGVYGLCAALGTLAGGATIVNMDAADGERAARLVDEHAVTHMFASDELYRRMLAGREGAHDPFPSARHFGYAAFNPGALEFAHEAWARRMPLFGLYGSSEVQALFAAQPAEAPLAERVEAGGQAVSPDAVVRVRDLETGGLAPPGVSGELEIRAPTSFIGYFEDAEATAQALTADGFFRTGDIGRLREDGSFVYETRKGDAIRLGGFLVSPAEIEDLLKKVPGVADAQVVAVELGGRLRAVAFAIAAPGTAPAAERVLEHARGLMAPYKVPAHVWFVDGFPRTESANGSKIQRARLREMARQALSSAKEENP